MTFVVPFICETVNFLSAEMVFYKLLSLRCLVQYITQSEPNNKGLYFKLNRYIKYMLPLQSHITEMLSLIKNISDRYNKIYQMTFGITNIC